MRQYIFLFCLAAALPQAAPARAAEGLLLRTINGHSRVIYAAALSPDGKVLASASVDNTIKLWNVSDGALLRTLGSRAGYSNALAFFPGGGRLASADSDGVIRIWDAATGALAEALGRRGDPALAVAVFPGGERLASGDADGTLRLWRAGSRRPVRAIRAHPGYVTAVAVSPDGKLLASASASEPIVRLWNAETGKAAGRLEGHSGAVNALDFSPSGERLVSAGEDGAVKVWGVSGGLCIQTLKSNKAVNAAVYSPDGAYIFSGGADDSVQVWKADGGTAPMAVLEGHAGVIKAIAAARDGKFLVSGGFDKALKIWLTPWEAKVRKAAVAAAEENARKFEEHYKAGLTLLSSPTMDNLRQATQEFTQALSYRDDPDCRAKLGEASAALVAKEKQRRLLAANALKGLAAVFFLLAVLKVLAVARRKSGERKSLPDEIKRQTLLGSYDKALELYKRYRAIGGDPEKLHAAELRDLYHSLRAIDELPKESLPYGFLLGWSAGYAKEGNYRLAALMLRGGQLADEFGKPEDFDAFAAIHRQAHGMEGLLAVRLKPETYSSLAEAFARAGDHAGCLRACALKRQFYPGNLSPRDQELLAAAQKNVPEPGAA
jgi:hypothetical protein